MKIGISTPAEQNKIDSSLVAPLMTCAKTHVLDLECEKLYNNHQKSPLTDHLREKEAWRPTHFS